MLRKLESLQGVSILSKEAQKKIAGGGSCGIIHTSHNTGSCLAQTGMSQNAAQSGAAAAVQQPFGESPDHAYWCCASCGNYELCLGDI